MGIALQEELILILRLAWLVWSTVLLFQTTFALRHARDEMYCSPYTGDVLIMRKSPRQDLWVPAEPLWGKSSNLPIPVCPWGPTLAPIFRPWHIYQAPCPCACTAVTPWATAFSCWTFLGVKRHTQTPPHTPAPKGEQLKGKGTG